MKTTKDEFKEEFADEYFEIGVTTVVVPENIKYACGSFKNYYSIAKNVTGAKSNGALRLLIGKLFINFEYGYHDVVSIFSDDDYMKYFKDQYFLCNKNEIGFNLYTDDDEYYTDEGYYPNPYFDLIKLEKYLSILVQQDEAVEEELITLYKNVIEFNKLTFDEKEKGLKSFFLSNYKFSEWVSEARDAMGDLLRDYNVYIENEEMFESCKKAIYSRINNYENECKNIAVHHEEMYLEILGVLNRIKNALEKEVVDIEELMKCREIFEEKITPMYDPYFYKAGKCREKK